MGELLFANTSSARRTRRSIDDQAGRTPTTLPAQAARKPTTLCYHALDLNTPSHSGGLWNVAAADADPEKHHVQAPVAINAALSTD